MDRSGARFGLRASYTILVANPASNANVDHHPYRNSDAYPDLDPIPDSNLFTNSNPAANANSDADSLAEGRFHP